MLKVIYIVVLNLNFNTLFVNDQLNDMLKKSILKNKKQLSSIVREENKLAHSTKVYGLTYISCPSETIFFNEINQTKTLIKSLFNQKGKILGHLKKPFRPNRDRLFK